MKNIDNAATDKISPFKKLTTEQEKLVNDIISFTKHHLTKNYPAIYTIHGDAGTGKSVILSQLFVRIQKEARTQQNSVLYHTNNYFLVNHPEILKVYKEIAGPIKELYKKDFTRPTSLINQLDKQNQTIDVAVIDEAHLLLSKPDHYNNFYHDNQLVEIIKRAKVVILVFDQYQVLRMKSLWTPERLQAITNLYPHKDYHLTHMFRMNASDDLVKWFNEFTNYRLTSLPASACDHYDFRIYDDAEEMRKAIVQRNKEVGLSRILSTSGYPSTLDGGKHYIEEGRFKMPWDQYNYTVTPWAELPQTINEVGSIYTCQGFDLNYTGIIIGPPISQIPQTNQLQVNLDRYTDVEAFKKRDDLTDPAEINRLEKRMIMNSLNVLFKRGVYGTYLYAHDPLLRHSLTALLRRLALRYQRRKIMMKEHELNKKWLIVSAIILAVIVLYFIYRTYKPEINLLLDFNGHNKAKLLHMIRSHGFTDIFLLVALVGILNAIPGMSNSVVCIFAGLCYGPIIGFLINWVGNILGNSTVMSIIRKINLSKRVKKNKILHYLLEQKHPLIALTIGFMIPVIPSVLVNYAGARLNVSRKHYLAMVTVGMAPTSFLYAFGGDAIFRGNIRRLIGVAIAILILIGCYLLVRKIWQNHEEKAVIK